MGEITDDITARSWDLNMTVQVKWHSEDDEMSHSDSLTISPSYIWNVIFVILDSPANSWMEIYGSLLSGAAFLIEF